MAEVSDTNIIVQDWVDALRSGKYKPHNKKDMWKNTLRLKDSDGGYLYNACGVLLDVYNNTLWKNGEFVISHDGSCIWDHYSNWCPPEVAEKIGMDRVKFERYLSLRKDYHQNFNQLADYIEQNMLTEEW